MSKTLLIAIVLLLSVFIKADAQPYGEAVAPLGYRVQEHGEGKYQIVPGRTSAKSTAIALPFIEDFTQDTYYPDTNKWVDRQVYINNTMGLDPPARGVATFDALREDGLPYEQRNRGVLRNADSLTSKPIDLSAYTAADSLYFSFFYQSQGRGFEPYAQDSLMLYFRRSNSTTPWTRVWRVAGSAVHPFRQVMIPITDAGFFNGDFQVRFVNKASMNVTDIHWNIDYIRLDANRAISDTTVPDVSFTTEPSFVLNDYTSMPYHQFLADVARESATEHKTTIRNNTNTPVNVTVGYNATERNSGTTLGSSNSSVSIDPFSSLGVSFPVYNTTVPAPPLHDEVVYQNKYFLQTPGSGLVENDTIVRQQKFANYLAYDDGTPEMSYYLKMFSTLPAKLVVEHRLNVPDTLKGIAIYFGRQIPLAYSKYFSMAVYRDIAYSGGTDQLIYQEDLLIPNYVSGQNFWYYKFRRPIVLPAGKFYIGTIQPALGNSDSLYFGLDVDRTTDNHVYFNVESYWRKSTVAGAIMMRPLFGTFFQTGIQSVAAPVLEWQVMPNPAADFIRVYANDASDVSSYIISDMHGRVLRRAETPVNGQIPITSLVPGMYMIQLQMPGYTTTPKKIIKL